MEKKGITVAIIPLFFIISMGILMRVLYAWYTPHAQLALDTFGYYEVGRDIFENPKRFFFNERRMPIYPLVLNTIMVTTQGTSPHIRSAEFANGAQIVLLVQIIGGLLTILCVFVIMAHLGLSALFQFLFTLFIATNILIFSWERVLLTEALSIVWTLLISLVFWKLFAQKRFLYSVLLSFLFLFGFLLRPFYVGLPFLFALFILLHLRSRFAVITAGIILLPCIILLVTITRHNRTMFGYPGITRASDINLLGKILQFRLPLRAGKQYAPELYEAATRYRSRNGDPMPYRFLDSYDPMIYGKTQAFRQISQFNRAVILANLPQFILASILQMPGAFLEHSELIALQYTSGFLGFFFATLFRITSIVQHITLLFPLAYCLFLIRYIKKPTSQHMFLVILGTVALYHLVCAVFLSYGEFGRLMAPAQPLLLLISVLFLYKVVYNRDIWHLFGIMTGKSLKKQSRDGS